MKRHPDLGVRGSKPRANGNGSGDAHIDRLNASYLKTRNGQSAAKLRLIKLKVAEQEGRLVPITHVQAMVSDTLSQLCQAMLVIPYRFKMQFRAIDATMTQQVGDWLRNDINNALENASRIETALERANPFERWYDREGFDDDDESRKGAQREQRVALNKRRREKREMKKAQRR
jgi:hypothetical protein